MLLCDLTGQELMPRLMYWFGNICVLDVSSRTNTKPPHSGSRRSVGVLPSPRAFAREGFFCCAQSAFSFSMKSLKLIMPLPSMKKQSLYLSVVKNTTPSRYRMVSSVSSQPL